METVDMSENDLKILIDKLNQKIDDDFIFLRPISLNVDFAKVWMQKPHPNNDIDYDGPNRFYFIKNDQGIYVATILDMSSNNLHWFVLEGHRGHGYLTNALRNTILPHLFQNRDVQKITIDELAIGQNNFKASQKVALSLGFVPKNKDSNYEYILSCDKYETEDYNLGQNTKISEDRIDDLKKQINYISESLWLVETEIEMKYGESDLTEDLLFYKDKIKKYCRILDEEL